MLNCKKIVAIMLTAIMILSMGVSSAAAEGYGADARSSIVAADPISDNLFAENSAISLKDAYRTVGTATVLGMVSYTIPNDTVILQDIIDGEVVGLQVYDYNKYSSLTAGSIVCLTGTLGDRYGARQLSAITSVKSLGKANRFKAQEVTVSELKNSSADYMSEYVVIKDATLGAIGNDGNASVSDSTGTINIYNCPDYPSNLSKGDKANIYAVCTKFNSTVQLIVGRGEDIVAPDADSHDEFTKEYAIDSSIERNIAQWAGTGIYEYTNVSGDLYETNDQLDENASFGLSTGKIPQITSTSTSTGSKNYFLGSKGFTTNDYYEMYVETEYFGALSLSFRMRGSATSAKYWKALYSTDGTNYNEIQSFNIKVDSVYQNYKINLPSECANQTGLIIRLQVSSPVPIKGSDFEISSSGANRIDEIAIKGNPIIDDDNITRVPHVSPASGEALIGGEITMACETSGATIYYSFDNKNFAVYSATNKPVFDTLPAKLFVYATIAGLKDSAKITYVYTYSQVGTVKISPNGGAVLTGKVIKLSSSTENATIKYKLVNAPDSSYTAEMLAELGGTWKIYDADTKLPLDTLPTTVVAYAEKNGYVDSPYTASSFSARENDEYSVYFGQLHSHTSYSDGAGTCQDAFEHGQQVKNLDYLAVTDHSNSFDNCDSASVLDGSASAEWIEGHQLADDYTTDKFTALYGYEMTWSNGLGHMNTYNTAGFQSRTQAAYTTYSTALQNYYSALKTSTGSISMFNHPGDTFGDFQDFSYYDDEIDQLINLIEVGNGEGAIGSSGYFPSYEYYTRALDKGWHIAPTNNQDNHKGMWGDANTARSVVLADGALTRDKIYDAMKNLRMYSTEDNDLTIQYFLDDNVMGTILDKEDVGSDVNIKVQLSDMTDSTMGMVEVIVNGGISLYSETVTKTIAELNFTLPADYSYYYIKVTQADGDIAVTAPVWVGEVEAVGVSSMTTDTKLPITNDPLNVEIELFNNEKTDLQIESVRFYANDEFIHGIDLEAEELTVLSAQSTKKYSFEYIGSKVGATEIKAVVTATLDGVNKIYNGLIKLQFVPAELVTNVLIDGTHYNDYVSGYYENSINNLSTICAAKYVKVDVEREKITAEKLADCSVLIISAPAKKAGTNSDGSYSATTYGDEFIKTVADYAKSGGNVILCGIADYNDKPGYSTSVEQNKLLAAIGSTLRINSDEAYDNVNYSGSSKYRLQLDDFNMESEYCKGIVQTEYDAEGKIVTNGQVYSMYSGCTVSLGSNGTALVRGHDTTYSINCVDENGVKANNEQVVEQGQVVALATEHLAGGGNVFAAGSVFVSDYEVKAELDNVWDQVYANRTIIENIIDSTVAEPVITDIEDVRKADIGEIFTVQGIVSAGTANENNKFFDTIYIQDSTGGITLFPFSEAGLNVGAEIRVTGYVDAYQGDLELQILTYKIIDNTNLKDVEPVTMTSKAAMDYDNHGGEYIRVTGEVTDVTIDNGVISQFKINDGSGEATIFIDGYILSGETGAIGKQNLKDFVVVGASVSAAGMLYKHPEGSSDESVPCLRVCNTDDICLPGALKGGNIKGDATGDGRVTLMDVTTIQRIIAGLDDFASYPAMSKTNCDVNADGNVNLVDVTDIQKFIAGLISLD